MAEETLKAAAASSEAPAAAAEVAVVPEAEKVEACEKEAVKDVAVEEEKEKVTASISFKEESNVVGELPDPQKKALDELKLLVQEALNKHEFTAPPPPPPVKEEEEEKKPSSAVEGGATVPTPVVESECKEEEKVTAVEPSVKEVTEVIVKAESCIDEDGAKKIEAIQETIVAVTMPAEPPRTEETAPPPCAAEETPISPEEISIWGIPLLADERSDVILLKFLRARDFKVKDAFAMLKNVVAWRKEFGIESLLEEDLGTEQDKVVYMHGVDKEGHPVCYNAYGEYQNKELYHETFSDEEKRTKFLRWRIQFLEKSIRKLDFSPDGICTIVQVNDLKNSPGPFKRELRQATNQALQLLQDNYPEFVAKQVFINVPWWYLAFYKMINPFFTQRTKSKFVFAGPSKTAETLFKYIAPELVPVQYGGLSREGEQEFTSADSVTEDIIKPATKHTIEFPAPETCTLVWEARVVGHEITYGAEFVPATEEGYTVIVQKSRKIAATTDEPVICGSFKCGEPGKVVLTFDNQTSKKKKVLYRSKTKLGSD
ncbi:patellin-3-like [Cynara cardunculus var. scolymus]|uniref:patellin-3-like n=1 Tax=Cynara cardunculus var. scolymus TaxID=59895 RepID=UPI000D62FC89|nr:patellin-3-like [Cynara cardunculus var. scolymus]